jgi:hypothetical protein
MPKKGINRVIGETGVPRRAANGEAHQSYTVSRSKMMKPGPGDHQSVGKKKASRTKTSKQTAGSKATKKPDTIYQLKITLADSKPPIWRRIQVKDCTLDKLHEHIQTAMGWYNSHLHDFRIGEQLYGDPLLMDENFEEMGYKDSIKTKLSRILPKTGGQFRFVYFYDFGDSWHHEIVFEKSVEAEAGRKYPLCLEGARACPPEDVGGVRGYAEFVKAIQNKKHKQHRELLNWIGGSFDPEAFDPVVATERMQEGLPNWRKMM